MANLRNRKEFREELIKALGITDDRDLENEYNFKRALLDGMGVSYITEDITNFDRYRAKILEGVRNGGGGGDCGDYTTAQVTLKTGDTGVINVPIPFISITGADFTVDGLTGGVSIAPNSEIVLTAILYEGKLAIHEFDFSVIIAQSTGAYEESDGYITITGECSIALRPKLN